MTADPALQYTVQELGRLLIERTGPNGTAYEAFGPYESVVRDLHEWWRSAEEDNQLAAVTGRAELRTDPSAAVRQRWDLLAAQPMYRELVTALQAAGVAHPAQQPDESLDWLRAQLELLPRGLDAAELRRVLDPTLQRIIGLSDDTLVAACLDELRRFFQWRHDTYRSYRDLVVKTRKAREKAARTETADLAAESEELGESEPPPLFLSPALAMHAGVVYVSQMMAFKVTSRTRKGAIAETVWRPVVITSDRRRIVPRQPPDGAPDGAIVWLDPVQRLALAGGFPDAPAFRWSYASIVGFLHGAVELPAAHQVYDALMTSLKRYVYHADESSYVVDALWAMGTYFFRLWNAYPYLALHGEKGAGKTTLLTWLNAVCFNAELVVNTSEASLYRAIESKGCTLLIDEQEGLNSSKAAKEQKADLMGILKSGYKAGAKVARQDMDQKERTRYFDVYSPKALAAIELFEDVLENRAILTYMTRKPAGITLDDDGAILMREASEFGPLRDMCYLLLMREAQRIPQITTRVVMEHQNRMRELFRPLYTMAALVDSSRGAGPITICALDEAAQRKAELRAERDRLSPEALLREALQYLASEATDDPFDYHHATALPSGEILVDTIQIKDAFDALFSTADQSYYNDHWLGKQVPKMSGIKVASPPRRRRVIERWNEDRGERDEMTVRVACYLLDASLWT